jgi:dTDP-4-amino-4,6-dideoxygalactose transaminase/predicted dehydrogenase
VAVFDRAGIGVDGISIALVGLGHRTYNRIIPAIESNFTEGTIVAACDIDKAREVEFSKRFPHVRVFQNVDDLVQSGVRPSFAYVSLPHNSYGPVVLTLLRAGINVLKEKPAAITLPEFEGYVSAAKDNGSRFGVAVQRRFTCPVLPDFIKQIGRIRSCEIIRKIVVPDLGRGWRAKWDSAGGGVVVDLGYHSLDATVELFGEDIKVAHATLMKTRFDTFYDVEDSAFLNLRCESDHSVTGSIDCNIVLSRAAGQEEERMNIVGEKGIVQLIADSDLSLYNTHGVLQGRLKAHVPYVQTIGTMLKSFASLCQSTTKVTLANRSPWSIQRDRAILRIIDAIYVRSIDAQPPRNNKFEWPRIPPSTEIAVVRQLHTSISIYDNSGVFDEFERSFATFIGKPDSFALLHNSGTNAIHALYYAASLRPSDEVILPVYTFHATCSPLMHLGAIPVFCDCLPNGTIDPAEIAKKITARTKAVVVSHMWGIPCKMHQIREICLSHNIMLLEDCSHAHGATIQGEMVGTFGDGAAWSLQGQKVLTGGEGGIVVTKHSEWHYRQLLLGHYNKRCMIEIPTEHPLRKFAMTGAGLKNRAHPLAIALALDQLTRVPQFLESKRRFADRVTSALQDIEFLAMPQYSEFKDKPAWYAFVMNFVASSAPSGCSRDNFVLELRRRGLSEVDIPRSTKPLQHEPLFVEPWEILPNYYSRHTYPGQSHRGGCRFPQAESFYDSAIKIPMWCFREEAVIIERYIQIFLEVAESFRQGQVSS